RSPNGSTSRRTRSARCWWPRSGGGSAPRPAEPALLGAMRGALRGEAARREDEAFPIDGGERGDLRLIERSGARLARGIGEEALTRGGVGIEKREERLQARRAHEARSRRPASSAARAAASWARRAAKSG